MTNTEQKQEKKLTPVGTILEYIDDQLAEISKTNSLHAAASFIQAVRKVAAAQLTEEQKVIEEAHKDGGRFTKWSKEEYDQRATEFFTNTYRQK